MTISPRASHAEREEVLEHLKRAYAEGRLEEAELELRVGLALTGKTRHDLESLLADLPAVVTWAAAAAASRQPVPAAARGRGAAGSSARIPARGRPGDGRHARFLPFARTAMFLLLAAAVTLILVYLAATLLAEGMSLHVIR